MNSRLVSARVDDQTLLLVLIVFLSREHGFGAVSRGKKFKLPRPRHTWADQNASK